MPRNVPPVVDTSSARTVALFRSVYDSANPTRRYLHHRRHEIVSALVGKYARTGRCLEVGIGANLYGDVLRAHARALVRLDIEREFVRFARAESSGAPPPAPAFIEGDIRRLPFRPASFDLVLFSEVIEHLAPADSRQALREIRRILAPSGAVILTTPQKHSPVERLVGLAARRPFRAVARLFYREPVVDNRHTNLLTRNEILDQVREAGLAVLETARCGMYVPLLAELGGEGAVRLERALERRIAAGPLGTLLWTQIHVLGVG